MTAVATPAGAVSDRKVDWHAINWQKAPSMVRRLQARIVQATQVGRWGRVKARQRLLTHSFSAKVLAVKRVTENQGKWTPGVDGVIWNTPEKKAMAVQILRQRGYQAVPLRRVYIPKSGGNGKRPLSIPTVGDRIAQMVAKEYLEPLVEPQFHPDSYGYRPGKSALQAVEVTRKRCWRYDWLVEYDIQKLFDSIDHSLMLRAVKHHTDCKWLLLYIERWLTAPMQGEDGKLVERTAGTPQGGVVSPLLANLFLHYVFDPWMVRTFPDHPWARYADDGVVHCRTEVEAKHLLVALDERFQACGLKLHPDKTQIIYCKDDDRRGTYPETRFDFLGYTFRPRRAKNRYGKFFVTFTPGVSNNAAKAMRQTIHDWRMHLKPDKALEDLSRMFNPVLRGWMHYYGRFYKSALYPTLRHMNRALVQWVRRKYKRFNRHRRRAEYWLGQVARREPKLFAHWQMGIKPAAG